MSKPTLDDIMEMLRNGEDEKKVRKAMEESGEFGVEKDYTGLLLAVATLLSALLVGIILSHTKMLIMWV